MPKPLRVLIVEDNPHDAELLLRELSRSGFDPASARVESALEMRAALEAQEWDVVLSDYSMRGFMASDALKLCREFNPDVPFIVLSGTSGEELAVAMMRSGASDYLFKGNLIRLGLAIERELRETENRRARRVAEQEIRRLAAVVETSADAILIRTLDGPLLTWNASAERLFGWTAAEAIGRSGILVPSHLAAETDAINERLKRGEFIPPFDTVRLHKNGTMIPVSLALSPMRAAEQVVSVSAIYRDITEQKKTEERRSLLATLVDSSEDAIVSTDLKGYVFSWNAAAEKLFGYSAAEVIGRSGFLIPPECIDRVRDIDLRLGRGETIPAFETVRLRKGGEKVSVHMVVSPVRVGGRVVFKSVIYRDITEKKKVEELLRASEARFRAVYDSNMLATFFWSGLGQVTECNDAFLAMVGYTRDDLTAGRMSWHEMTPTEYHQRDQVALAEVARSGHCIPYEKEYVRKDGSRVPILFGAAGLAGDKHRVAFAIDLTERNLATARHTAVLNVSLDAIITMDHHGIIVETNWAAEKIFGYSQAEMVGKEMSELILPPSLRQAYRRGLDHFLATGEGPVIGARFEQTAVRANGSEFPIELAIAKIPGHGLPLFTGFVRDLTNRKQTLADLQRSEERYRTLIATTTAIVWNSPASGAFDTDQPSWTAFTGQTVDQHRGWGWLDVIHPDDRERSGQAWAAAVAGKGDYQIEHRLRRADGVYRHMSVRAVPILEFDGTIREWVGVHTDVHEHRMSEAKIRQREQHLTAIIENSPDCVKVIARDGTVLEMNAAGLGMVEAASPQQVIGKSAFDLIAPEFVERYRALHEAACQGQRADLKFEVVCLNGARKTLQAVATPLVLEDGQTVHLGISHDISEARRLEEQFRQAQKMDAFGQLAGGVAHDFNNLLTIINGYSELLLQSLPQDDPSWKLIDEIHQAGERSAGLTRQLLAFSRQQILAPRVLNLNDVVADTDKMLRRLIGEDIRLTSTLESNPWSVRADPGQVEQVLLNLAVNARDAMPKGGRLTIETKNVELDESYVHGHKDARAGRHVLLSVTDTGSGISAAVIAKIFEPFFTTKETGKGSGLGLATVYGIVKQSGGHVAVYSEVGIGSTFKVYLPQVEQGPEGSTASSRILAPPRGTETILLAEDEVAVRTLTRTILAECGYHVLEAVDGDEAVRVAAEHHGPIHLLITDVVMPGAGGRAAAEQITQQFPTIRIIYMSGYTDDAVIRHGVLREGVNYIQKPFSPSALARKVREILDGTA